jgi:hypothetical protein
MMGYGRWDGVHGTKATALALGREYLRRVFMLVYKCIANEFRTGYIEAQFPGDGCWRFHGEC